MRCSRFAGRVGAASHGRGTGVPVAPRLAAQALDVVPRASVVARFGSRDSGDVTNDVSTAAAVSVLQFPDGPPLAGAGVDLKPLRMEHAEEMFALLSDPWLHVFIGGEPVSLPDLRKRYRRQVAGPSTDGSQRWLNWVVRRREDKRAVGTVQATISQEADAVVEEVAEVAWVIASPGQGKN